MYCFIYLFIHCTFAALTVVQAIRVGFKESLFLAMERAFILRCFYFPLNGLLTYIFVKPLHPWHYTELKQIHHYWSYNHVFIPSHVWLCGSLICTVSLHIFYFFAQLYFIDFLKMCLLYTTESKTGSSARFAVFSYLSLFILIYHQLSLAVLMSCDLSYFLLSIFFSISNTWHFQYCVNSPLHSLWNPKVIPSVIRKKYCSSFKQVHVYSYAGYKVTFSKLGFHYLNLQSLYFFCKWLW